MPIINLYFLAIQPNKGSVLTLKFISYCAIQNKPTEKSSLVALKYLKIQQYHKWCKLLKVSIFSPCDKTLLISNNTVIRLNNIILFTKCKKADLITTSIVITVNFTINPLRTQWAFTRRQEGWKSLIDISQTSLAIHTCLPREKVEYAIEKFHSLLLQAGLRLDDSRSTTVAVSS